MLGVWRDTYIYPLTASSTDVTLKSFKSRTVATAGRKYGLTERQLNPWISACWLESVTATAIDYRAQPATHDSSPILPSTVCWPNSLPVLPPLIDHKTQYWNSPPGPAPRFTCTCNRPTNRAFCFVFKHVYIQVLCLYSGFMLISRFYVYIRKSTMLLAK